MQSKLQVILTSRIRVSNTNALQSFLQQNLPNIRGFNGCFSVEVLLNKEERNMVFFEEWESEEHHRKYIDFIVENGVMEQLNSFLTGPPSVDYYKCLTI